MDEVKIFKTECQKERYLAIYNEYNDMEQAQNPKMLILERLLKGGSITPIAH